ncbi:MAG: T9SS type A sorting domain-containing protein, partial [Candidatus Marinimicrobia bacterium]|nr:T9SS type A sorting domain-containing protein [Candidatus Neomarinimicrobiota bacterium]
QYSGISSLRATAPWLKKINKQNFQEIAVPISIYHVSNPLVEAEDQLALEFKIQPKGENTIDLDNSFVYYKFEEDENFYQTSISHLQNDNYEATLNLGGYAGNVHYYFSISDFENNTLTNPLAAPSVYFNIPIGPDTTAPEVTGYYFNPYHTVFHSGEKLMESSITVIDRFPIDTMYGQIRINTEEWQDIEPDSVKFFPYYDEFYVYFKIQWKSLDYGDIIEHRFVLIDSSLNRNVGYTSVKNIAISHYEDLTLENNLRNWINEGWDRRWSSEGLYFVADSISPYRTSLNIKTTYPNPIPLLDYNTFYLNFIEICNINAGDTGFVEINPDNDGWIPIVERTACNWSQKENIFRLTDFTEADTIRLRFRLQTDNQVDETGLWAIGNINFFADTTLVVSIKDIDMLHPAKLALHQNYPNPFNPTTTISFELPKETYTEINIYNLAGQPVKTLLNEVKSAGRHQIIWDAGTLPSGIYFYQIKVEDTAGNRVQTKKCVLLK